jgi:hypothetical protein
MRGLRRKNGCDKKFKIQNSKVKNRSVCFTQRRKEETQRRKENLPLRLCVSFASLRETNWSIFEF